MDDLDGLFGSAPTTAPQPQLGNMVAPQLGNFASPHPGTMGAPHISTMGAPHTGNPNMMIPTQTTEASQQANKTQILNQFQAGPGQALYGGHPGVVQPGLGQGGLGGPARPAPGAPGLGAQFPGQQFPGQTLSPPDQSLPVGSSGNLILSNSFTEPGPVDLDPCADPFAETKEPTVDIPDAGSSFYIDENEISEPTEDAKTENVKEDAKDTLAPEASKEVEAVTPQPKTSFWSRWSRSKDSGSKENILEENDKKSGDKQNDDGRGGNQQKFLGDGQTFKGKLIGVLEVREARGDRMCQDALQELKMAIKASGEHKQKVNIQIAVDGLKIRDEKSGDCLYHHPVHKISFIAQDMTDNRAFGYIYGSPENGHRFFGIKTEKAAGQVVVAMRDLFQVVFELKKKEIDEAKQNIETGDSATDTNTGPVTSAASFPDGSMPAANKSSAIDDLLGLENEISAIQAGIQQIDKITPNPPMSFQTDSMLPLSLSGNQQPVVQQPAQKKPVAVMNQNPTSDFGTAPFLPPPPSKVGRRQEDRYAVFESVPQNQNPPQQQQNTQGFGGAPFLDSGTSGDSSMPSIFSQPASLAPSDNSSGMFGGLDQSQGMFGQPAPPQPQVAAPPPPARGAATKTSGSQDLASLFTDLDPLGSGKSKPLVDKKDFFTDSKAKLKMTGASADSLTNAFLHPMYQSRSVNLL